MAANVVHVDDQPRYHRGDAEEGFFDYAAADQRNAYRGGLRRETMVEQINEEESPAVEKLRSDTLWQLLYESVYFGFIVYLIKSDQLEADLVTYLTWLLIANYGVFQVIKVVLFFFTAGSRSPDVNSSYALVVMGLQSLTNSVFYILSKTAFPVTDLQDAMWNHAEGNFLVKGTLRLTYLIQYYWFLLIIMLVLALILVLVLHCLGFDVDAQGDGVDPATREETNSALSRLSRMFDWNKFTEHEECIICLQAFTSEDMVTPLPCDKRHYFHSQCIEEWSKNHSECPLCKKQFDAQSIHEALARRSTVAIPGGMRPQGGSINDGPKTPLLDSAPGKQNPQD